MKLNNLLKAAARKHALANGIATAKWSDQDFIDYIAENGITERDNLKTGNHSTTQAAEKIEQVEEQPEPEEAERPAGSVDKAIQDLIAAMDIKAEANLDEQRVIDLINQHSKRVTITVENEKTREAKTVEGAHKDFPTVLNVIAAGVNIAAVGPAGSGKSTIFEQAAAALDLPYYFQGAVQQEHKIMGFIDANGTYHRTPFRDAFENGGVYVQEEFDGSNARAMLAINNASANETCDFPDGMVKKHKDFVLVMAGNTFGTGASRQYVGRQQLDAATLDRFAFIEIGYDEDLERALGIAHNEKQGAEWTSIVQTFRRKVEAAGLRHVVSPRATIMGAKLLKQGVDLATVKRLVLHKGMTQDQLQQVAR